MMSISGKMSSSVLATQSERMAGGRSGEEGATWQRRRQTTCCRGIFVGHRRRRLCAKRPTSSATLWSARVCICVCVSMWIRIRWWTTGVNAFRSDRPTGWPELPRPSAKHSAAAPRSRRSHLRPSSRSRPVPPSQPSPPPLFVEVATTPDPSAS